MKITVAITGASGTIYAQRLIRELVQSQQVSQIAVVMTTNARDVARHELGQEWEESILGCNHSPDPVAPTTQSDGPMSILGCPKEPQPRQGENFANSLGAKSTDRSAEKKLSKIVVYDNTDFFTPIASGSSGADAMVVLPCSMGMVGRIAHGISDDLVSRAADVMLKERQLLIIVPRESPMSTIHLANLLTLAQAGATIIPASPSFYHNPGSVTELVDSIVERILKQLKIRKENSYRWKS